MKYATNKRKSYIWELDSDNKGGIAVYLSKSMRVMGLEATFQDTDANGDVTPGSSDQYWRW